MNSGPLTFTWQISSRKGGSPQTSVIRLPMSTSYKERMTTPQAVWSRPNQ